jgi:hypothetical protein
MLSPQELRIGNYVLGKRLNGLGMEVFRVYEVLNDGIVTSEFVKERGRFGVEIKQGIGNRHDQPFGWLKGIPITETFIRAIAGNDQSPTLGEHTKVHNFRLGDYDRLLLKMDGSVVLALHSGQYEVKYVHHLQNLYMDWSLFELPFPYDFSASQFGLDETYLSNLGLE